MDNSGEFQKGEKEGSGSGRKKGIPANCNASIKQKALLN